MQAGSSQGFDTGLSSGMTPQMIFAPQLLPNAVFLNRAPIQLSSPVALLMVPPQSPIQGQVATQFLLLQPHHVIPNGGYPWPQKPATVMPPPPQLPTPEFPPQQPPKISITPRLKNFVPFVTHHESYKKKKLYWKLLNIVEKDLFACDEDKSNLKEKLMRRKKNVEISNTDISCQASDERKPQSENVPLEPKNETIKKKRRLPKQVMTILQEVLKSKESHTSDTEISPQESEAATKQDTSHKIEDTKTSAKAKRKKNKKSKSKVPQVTEDPENSLATTKSKEDHKVAIPAKDNSSVDKVKIPDGTYKKKQKGLNRVSNITETEKKVENLAVSTKETLNAIPEGAAGEKTQVPKTKNSSKAKKRQKNKIDSRSPIRAVEQENKNSKKSDILPSKPDKSHFPDKTENLPRIKSQIAVPVDEDATANELFYEKPLPERQNKKKTGSPHPVNNEKTKEMEDTNTQKQTHPLHKTEENLQISNEETQIDVNFEELLEKCHENASHLSDKGINEEITDSKKTATLNPNAKPFIMRTPGSKTLPKYFHNRQTCKHHRTFSSKNPQFQFPHGQVFPNRSISYGEFKKHVATIADRVFIDDPLSWLRDVKIAPKATNSQEFCMSRNLTEEIFLYDVSNPGERPSFAKPSFYNFIRDNRKNVAAGYPLMLHFHQRESTGNYQNGQMSDENIRLESKNFMSFPSSTEPSTSKQMVREQMAADEPKTHFEPVGSNLGSDPSAKNNTQSCSGSLRFNDILARRPLIEDDDGIDDILRYCMPPFDENIDVFTMKVPNKPIQQDFLRKPAEFSSVKQECSIGLPRTMSVEQQESSIEIPWTSGVLQGLPWISGVKKQETSSIGLPRTMSVEQQESSIEIPWTSDVMQRLPWISGVKKLEKSSIKLPEERKISSFQVAPSIEDHGTSEPAQIHTSGTISAKKIKKEKHKDAAPKPKKNRKASEPAKMNTESTSQKLKENPQHQCRRKRKFNANALSANQQKKLNRRMALLNLGKDENDNDAGALYSKLSPLSKPFVPSSPIDAQEENDFGLDGSEPPQPSSSTLEEAQLPESNSEPWIVRQEHTIQ